MATLNASNPTLLDVMKRLAPDGTLMPIVEAMQQATPLLQDMTWVEGNTQTGHKFNVRNGLPTVSWRRLNEGVASSKSDVANYVESCGILNGRAEVDRTLAQLSGNENGFRLQESMAFMQALSKELETGLFYHSTKTAPEKIMGLAPRLDSTSGPMGSQIVKFDASASGSDSASVWIVGWGPRKVYGIYPKGSMAGIKHTPLPEPQLIDDGTGKKFLGLVDDWEWTPGLCVEDARYLVRLCNIDAITLVKTGKLLIEAMIDAVEQMQDLDSCRPVIYCNRKIRTYLRQQAVDTTKNATLTFENIGGKTVLQFAGIPVKRTDALLNTEAPVS